MARVTPGTQTVAKDLFPGFTSTPLAYTPPDKDFVATNPSIFFDGNQWRCMLRCINYRLGQPIPRVIYTRTVMTELDPNQGWGILAAIPMADRAERVRTNYHVHGYEDARLFTWKGKLWASATCCDLTAQGNREIVLLELDSTYAIVSATPLRGAWSRHYQKNWIPVVRDDRLSFVYAIDRGIVLDVSTNPIAVADMVAEDGLVKRQGTVRWPSNDHLRGSSQAMRIGDKWMILVHDRFYRSRFVLANDLLRITHWTPEFHFRQPGIEFSAGAALDLQRKNQRVVVSYSVNDATCELGFFPLESVMATFEPMNRGQRIIRS